jgi:uncharacterized protein
MKVLITGGTGLIGRALTKKLLDQGHQVQYLSRKSDPNARVPLFKWDIDRQQIDMKAFEGVEAIIHLAGAGIAEARWTAARKAEILHSRVNSTKLLTEAISQMNPKPKVFVGSSAVGFYGATTSSKIYNESDAVHKDFLGNTCLKWEQSYSDIRALGIRTVIIRIGIVLSSEGGALERMAQPVKWGIGSALGSGKQFVPWIHVNDIAGVFFHALSNVSLNGVYNGVADEAATNKQLTAQIAKTLNRPFFMPSVPAFIMRLVFGEMAQAFLEGSRVDNQKIKQTGYVFQFSTLKAALDDLFKK